MSGSWSSHDIPEHVLGYQQAWERRHRVLAAFECSGLNMTALAKDVGVSVGRIGQMIQRARRESTDGIKCPVELWLATREQTFPRSRKLPKVAKAIDRLVCQRDWLIP